MQFKLVVYNPKKVFEGYPEVFANFKTEGRFNNSTMKQIYDIWRSKLKRK